MTKIQAEIKEIQGHRQEYQRCINTEDGIMTAATAKLKRNTDILASTEEMCKLFAAEFNEAEAARRSERHLLAALKTMLQAKIQENF